MEYNIPTFQITIDDNYKLGVEAVALVENPAIEIDWITLAVQNEIKLAAVEDKQMLYGPALIPDKQIYRRDSKGNEYYIVFSKETIAKIVDRYFKQGNHINFNLEHNDNLTVPATVNESWIVKDPEKDQSALYGFALPVGTWMLGVHIDDTAYWNEFVKTNKVKGFSIEGEFGQELISMNKEIALVEPKKGEHEADYIPRCIAYMVGQEGTDPSQAAAICHSKWDAHVSMAEDSYNDYPQAASDNAQRALNWAEKNGWGSCGTDVGKQRANQLAKRENITRDTIARMASFERHRQNSKTPYGEGCGKLMWDAWGGDEGIAWAQRKLEQIDKAKLAAETVNSCPIATQDIPTNLKNRQVAIDKAHYGPLDPNLPNDEYWAAKAKMFNDSPENARKATCSNCAFFNISKKIEDCIAKAIGTEGGLDPFNVIDAGKIGYCEAWDFKCAGARTCDAWVAGGPVTMFQEFRAGDKVSFDFDGTLSTPLGKQLAQHEIKSGTTVYIISARSDASSMYSVADALGIPHSRVYATGSNIDKVTKIKELGIDKHYDNNRNVVKMLPKVGVSFSLTEEETLTLIEAVIKDDSIPE